jgi:hypothetical protein
MGKVSSQWMLGLTWLVAAQSAMASGWHVLRGGAWRALGGGLVGTCSQLERERKLLAHVPSSSNLNLNFMHTSGYVVVTCAPGTRKNSIPKMSV